MKGMNFMKVKNEKELGEALHKNIDRIEVDFDLMNKVVRLKATGSVAWGVCIGCMAVAIVAVSATVISGGTASPATVPAAVASLAPAAGILGMGTAFSAASIGAGAAAIGGSVSAGIAALNKLRKYDMIKEKDRLILIRK